MWNPESWALGSGIQLKESGIPLTRFRLESRIQVPPTMTAIQYLESTSWNPKSKTVLDLLTCGKKNLLRMIVMWTLKGGLLEKLTVNHAIICVASFKGFFVKTTLPSYSIQWKSAELRYLSDFYHYTFHFADTLFLYLPLSLSRFILCHI